MTNEELEKRNERSKNLEVFKIRDREYFVESSNRDIGYKVILNNGQTTCTCPDFQANISKNSEFKCKHILAVNNGNGNIHDLCNSSQRQKLKLDDRWITSIKGKDFVVFPGLLDLSHKVGLQSISVEVMQYPTKENGNIAICKAISITKDGEIYQDIGDANPNNVNKLVINHILRVASTRAIARTLRLMTNIGMTALEELGDDDDVEPTNQKRNSTNAKSQQTRQQPTQQDTKAKSQKSSETKAKDSSPTKTEKEGNGNSQRDLSSNGKPSQSQLNAIKNLASRKSMSEEDIEKLAQDKLQATFQNLSSDQAGQLIKLIQSA